MTLRDDFAAVALPSRLDHLGEAITYTAPDGTETAIAKASVGPIEADDQVETGQAVRNINRRRRVIFATHTDLIADYGGVATPSEGGTLTIDGETWAIDRLTRGAEGYCVAFVVRPSSAEVRRERGRNA